VNSAEAKQILLLYRPGTRDAEDPQIIEAMSVASADPELAQWFAQHQELQVATMAKFRAIPAPQHLKNQLLAHNKIVVPHGAWQRPLWLAAAAIFVLLLGLALFLPRASVPDRFTNFREIMVSAAVRTYAMDLMTNDMVQLRQFIDSRGAPADYQLTKGLARLDLKGGGLLRWRGNPVSMVCFDKGGGTTLFLFITKRSAVKDPPPSSAEGAELARVDGLITASWTNGSDTYLLAGPDEPGFAEKYLKTE
jgi:hypothetical protein